MVSITGGRAKGVINNGNTKNKTHIGFDPGFYESQHITAVVHAVKKFLAVLVIDDGSTDDTTLQAASAGAEVLCQKNQGKGAALQAGFRKALEKGYDAVLTLDGDGQHDPQEILLFCRNSRKSGGFDHWSA